MEFSREAFNEFVLKNGVIGFKDEPVTYKSGRQGHCYVNWRNVANDAFLLDQLTDHLVAFTKARGLTPRSFYGVPEGATKLGVITQYKWAKMQPDYAPGAYGIAMGRAKPKDHGDPKDAYFVGMPQGDTIVIEDTTTTGGSLIETIDKLHLVGVHVIAAIALTNRNEIRDDGMSVPHALQAKAVPYFALSDLKDMLPAAYEQLQPRPEIRAAVEAYFNTYGAKN